MKSTSGGKCHRENALAQKSLQRRAAIWLSAIRSSQAAVFKAVGEGDDVRLTGVGIAAAALVARERAIHLSAFASQ